MKVARMVKRREGGGEELGRRHDASQHGWVRESDRLRPGGRQSAARGCPGGVGVGGPAPPWLPACPRCDAKAKSRRRESGRATATQGSHTQHAPIHKRTHRLHAGKTPSETRRRAMTFHGNAPAPQAQCPRRLLPSTPCSALAPRR